MTTLRRVQYATTLQCSSDTGKSCSASGGVRQNGYLPTLICVGRTATFHRQALPNAFPSL